MYHTDKLPVENSHHVKLGASSCVDEDTLYWEETAISITLRRSVGGGAMEEMSGSDLAAPRTYRSKVIRCGWTTNEACPFFTTLTGTYLIVLLNTSS